MKKIILFMMIACFVISCNKEEPIQVKESSVTLTAEVLGSDFITKTSNVSVVVPENYKIRYILEIYDNNTLFDRMESFDPTFELKLLNSRAYNFVFWADFVDAGETNPALNSGLYDASDLAAIKLKSTSYKANNPALDAFYFSEEITVKGPVNRKVTLKRPFAQIRVRTTDLDLVSGDNIPKKIALKYKKAINSTFNAISGEASAPVADFTGTIADIGLAPYYKTTPEDESLMSGWLSFDYIFVSKDNSNTVDFDIEIFNSADASISTSSFTDIPVKQNYRTTISGNLLTKSGKIKLEIDAGFEGDIIPASIIVVDKDKIDAVPVAGGSYEVSVLAAPVNEYEVIITDSWISYSSIDKGILVAVAPTTDFNPRMGTVSFKLPGSSTVAKTITITQNGAKDEVVLVPDTKVTVASAWASEAQPNYGIDKTIDGTDAGYHTPWMVSAKFPVILKYNFENQDRVDYINVTGGAIVTNGNFKVFELYYKPVGGERTLFDTYDFEGKGGIRKIDLGIENPEYIEFQVLSGNGNFVSCKEMEFFKYAEDNAIPSVFVDASCSELKAGTTKAQIEAITKPFYKNIAVQLFEGTYDPMLAKAYKALPAENLTINDLKISQGFSQFENMTGIYLEKGKTQVLVGPKTSKTILLRLPNWMRKTGTSWGLEYTEYSLNEGVNLIDVPYSTNAYIYYFDENPDALPEVKINFPSGKVNGIFDARKHTKADWTTILNNAPGEILDMVGEYIQVAYPVSYLKMYALTTGPELIKAYDDMLRHHYTLMGCFKYNRVPKSKILARVNYHYYMFRDRNGVAYLGDNSTMNMVVNVNNVTKGDPCWGFCHEVGHVLQMPQLKWGGMGEVSNNIFSMYTHIAMGNTSLLKSNNTYAKAKTEIIDKGISYINQGDVFARLVPFWQLHLYASQKLGKNDFYADAMEAMRTKTAPGPNWGSDGYKNMLDFVKISCDVLKTDLTDFFDKYGFFIPGEYSGDDYGKFKYIISQEEIDAVKAYIASKEYPKPLVDVTTVTDL